MAIWPHRANYVVAIDGFIGRETLLRNVGCICKRKFTQDITLVRQLRQVVKNGDVAMIYPEARYSLCGTTAVLPASLGKLCRLLGVPVVTLICHGHHVNSPFWNLHDRGMAPTEAELTVLYSADAGETEFSHIPDWYEWERSNVRREVEAGTYSTGPMPVTVDTLPNAKRFLRLGEEIMVHDMSGFSVHGTDVDGDPFSMEKIVPILYSCHIKYEYLGKHGDCVDLNTLEDTWYIYPHDCRFAVTKMALATEELYYAHRRSIGRPCKPGLA